jgi:hypothetical protein
MLHTMNGMMERITRHNLSLARGRVHLLPAPVAPGLSPLDFRRSSELIQLGLTGARRWLAESESAPRAPQTRPHGLAPTAG